MATQQKQVVLFVEGDTEVWFFGALLDYYRTHSTTSMVRVEICNMKGVTRYSSRLKAKLKGELLPKAKKENRKISCVCCSYDTDVFELNPQLVDWTAIKRMVAQLGIEHFRQIGIEQMIEDWILDDMSGVCRYLKLKQVPISQHGRNGFEKLQNLFHKAGKDYTKGNAAKDVIAALDMSTIRQKHAALLAGLEKELNVKIKMYI